MPDPELLPCPHCGEPPVLIERRETFDGAVSVEFEVRCSDDCNNAYTERAASLRAWNRREP